MPVQKYLGAAILLALSVPLSASALIVDGGREARSPMKKSSPTGDEQKVPSRKCCNHVDMKVGELCQSGGDTKGALVPQEPEKAKISNAIWGRAFDRSDRS